MARAKQPVSVDDIEFDALIDSEEGYEADVPEYPTEKGFSVSDTIVLKADTLNMTLYVTDTPVTWRKRTGSGPGKTEGVVRRLKDLYFAKKILEVTTTDCVYSNMVITCTNDSAVLSAIAFHCSTFDAISLSSAKSAAANLNPLYHSPLNSTK